MPLYVVSQLRMKPNSLSTLVIAIQAVEATDAGLANKTFRANRALPLYDWTEVKNLETHEVKTF